MAVKSFVRLFQNGNPPSKRYNTSAVFAKALSEKLNVCVKRSFVTEEVVAPDLAYKLFTGECKSFVLYHVEKEFVFLWRHLNSFAVNCNNSG